MTNARRQTQYRPCVHTLTLAHNETTQAKCKLKAQEQSETDANKEIDTQYKILPFKQATGKQKNMMGH